MATHDLTAYVWANLISTIRGIDTANDYYFTVVSEEVVDKVISPDMVQSGKLISVFPVGGDGTHKVADQVMTDLRFQIEVWVRHDDHISRASNLFWDVRKMLYQDVRRGGYATSTKVTSWDQWPNYGDNRTSVIVARVECRVDHSATNPQPSV